MFYSAAGTMVLKSELLAVLNMYGSGELNEVTVFLPYFFWVASNVASERQSFTKCFMLRSHDRVQSCSLQV